MTPKTIELKQAPVALVELPEGATLKYVSSFDSYPPIQYMNYELTDGEEMKSIQIPVGFYYEGILSDLTEEQFAECVDFWDSVSNDGSKVYENYTDSVPKKKTAKDSFHSLLESEKVYTENPYGKQPTKYKGKDLPKQVRKEMYSFAMQKWHEAQQRTIDPTRTVVLLRKEDVK